MRVTGQKSSRVMLAGVVVIATGMLFSIVERLEVRTVSDAPFGSARLVSIAQLSEYTEMCLPEEMETGHSNLVADNLFAAFKDEPVYASSQDAGQTVTVARPPVRNILDTDPIYSAVAVDVQHDEVFLQDTNTWSIRVFNRLDNTPANAPRTEPKRVIGGENTDIQFNSCIYIDPKNGDIYTVENDIGDSIAVFSRDANGNVAPIRKLNVTHRAYAMAVDEEKEELYVTVQYPPAVEIYRKTASGNEKPLRVVEGEATRLSDAHGIAIDVKNKLMFVNNWGNISDYRSPGTGRFEAPSITVHSLDAKGDAPPLRVIQGPNTQLNWPGVMSMDPDTLDLYVANDLGQAVLVFRGTDQGNVRPQRVIKGGRTGLSYPVAVFVDTKNKELWASNIGNASATVYPLTANGNVAPLRTIRSAPAGKVSLRFGKTQALAYDTKRETILVPN